MIIGQTHIGLFISDCDASCKFYHDVLDFEILWKGTNEDADGIWHIAELKNNDLIIEIVQPPKHVLGDRTLAGSVDHIAVKTDDIEGEFERMKSLGYEPLSDIVVNPTIFGRGGRWFFILGPDGERIEIACGLE